MRQSFYSVPVGLARRRVTVRLGARSLEVIADGKMVACHQRSLHKGTEDLVLDHYLEILVRKPGALPGSTALAQARAVGAFTQTHERFWAQARRRLGDGAGTRALIAVLAVAASPGRSGGGRGHERRRWPSAASTPRWWPSKLAASTPAARPRAVVPIGAGARDVRPAPRLDRYDALLAAGSDR